MYQQAPYRMYYNSFFLSASTYTSSLGHQSISASSLSQIFLRNECSSLLFHVYIFSAWPRVVVILCPARLGRGGRCPTAQFLLELCGRRAPRDGSGETDRQAYFDRFETGQQRYSVAVAERGSAV